MWLPHAGDGEEAARAELDVRGLRAVAVAVGGIYSRYGDALERGARLAVALGAPVVVACVAPGLLPELVARVDPRVTLCLENHWDHPVAHPLEVMRELAGVPRAAACLDTGHSLAAGDDPCAAARLLAARLGHVHLKDARAASLVERLAGRRVRKRLGGRPAPRFPGSGDLDVPSVLGTLAAVGYRGAVSVEYEGSDATRAVAALAAAARG